jgi:penicillin G amidase
MVSARALLPIVSVAMLAMPRPAAAVVAVPAETTLTFSELSAPVRLVVDRWGIPHIQARNLADLYFAWGVVTARDRLWQLEVTRRAASGTLWEWFGNRSLTSDGGAQLFGLRERAELIWKRERGDPEVREALERYAAGINAWIEHCWRTGGPWPAEFVRLRQTPGTWKPENAYLVLLAQGLQLDFDLPELDEAREIREHGLAWVEARHRFERDMRVSSIPDSVAARLYGHASRRPPRSGAAVASPALSEALLAEARRTVSGIASPPTRDPDERASNVFALGPRRGAHGAPLLANDPHLGLSTPGPLHVVHLSVPGVLEVAGAYVPGLPLIVSGRNPRCAWGLTALGADVMDVYADTLSRDGRQVRWRGAWAPVREAPYTMRYRVLGLLPVPTFGQVRRYTPHGPVVAWDRKHRLALSVRWAGDDEAITLSRLLGMERSEHASEIAAAVRTLVTPTANVVSADRDGHVIYQTVGALPRRGFTPAPGPLPDDERHEWLGLVPPDSMPRWELGPNDFVVNGNNLPVGSPYPEPFPRYEFMQDRAARMAQRLAGDASVTLADLRSVQNDVVSRGAGRFVPLLLRCADSLSGSLSPGARAALDTLRGWDYRVRRDRVAPTLFRGWLGALQRRSRLEGLPMLTAAALDGRAPEALRAPGSETPERAALAASAALETSLVVLERNLGPVMARWRWGLAHRARFRHALAWRDSTLSPPPLPADGDNSTVSVGRSSLPWSTVFTHGPVWRHLVDLSVTDSSLCVVPPGNAAAGPHARDMMTRWANHGYVPLYLDWARIERAAEIEVAMTPGVAAPVGSRR